MHKTLHFSLENSKKNDP